MKIEPRGKYAGVKVHLDGEESREILTMLDGGTDEDFSIHNRYRAFAFILKLASKIERLKAEHPHVLEDRTDEEIAAALQRDLEKIEAQQAAMSKGKDWREV